MKTSKGKTRRVGRVYLMVDLKTNKTKIGWAMRPKVREKTLQSERPCIMLMYSFVGTMADEHALHKQFAHKRVRGEWFDLDKGDNRVIQSKNYPDWTDHLIDDFVNSLSPEKHAEIFGPLNDEED